MKAINLLQLLEVKAPSKLREIFYSSYRVITNPYQIVMGKPIPQVAISIFALASYLKNWGVKKVKLNINNETIYVYREKDHSTYFNSEKVYQEFLPDFKNSIEINYFDYLLTLDISDIDKLELKYLDNNKIELPTTTKPKVDID